MEPNKVFLVTFSPTHTSLKIGKEIVKSLAIDNVEILNLTLISEISPIEVTKDTLVVFALPVYGGLVAPLAMERLSGLKADGALAVTVVLYGNRAFDNALTQLNDFVTERGCRVIAAGGFVGEHSYSNSKYPIAVGRPNVDDLYFAESFGAKIKEKIEKVGKAEDIAVVDAKNIVTPNQTQEQMIAFFTEVKQAMISGAPSPKGPSVDESLCTACGTCAQVCPTGAITEGDELHTDYEKCIKCCACIKLCPSQARYINTPFSPLLNKYFGKNKENVILL